MPVATRAKTSEGLRQHQSADTSLADARQPDWAGPYADVLALQRAAGNRAVRQLLQSGTANPASAMRNVSPMMASRLRQSDGQPLDPATRAFMEHRFEGDFSQVQVHADTQAAQIAKDLNAEAFTTGQDIYFAQGAYSPTTQQGQRIIAHELAHVRQQAGGHSKSSLLRRASNSPTAVSAHLSSLPAEERAETDDVAQRKEKVAREVAANLTTIAQVQSLEKGQTAEIKTLEQEAERASDAVTRGQSVPASSSASRTTILRLPDVAGRTASVDTMDFLTAAEDVQNFPLLSVILASPTLRPYDVEQAARTGTLTDFSRHPGSTFLGAVAEALVFRALKFQSQAGVRGRVSTHVFPQPGTLVSLGIKLPPEATPLLALIGSLLPDLLVILIGGELRLGPFRIRQDVEFLNIVDPSTGRVGSRTFTGRTVIAFVEVTASTQFRFIEPRGAKVAAMAKVLKVAKLPAGLEAVAMLAIDRGAFFSLSTVERDALTKTVDAAGGLIALFRDLTSVSLQDARIVAQELASLNP